MFRLSSIWGLLFIGSLIFAFVLRPSSFGLLFAPSPVFATCYCADPTADQCKCAAAPPADAIYSGDQDGVAVKCTTQGEANSTFEKKNPICGSAVETIPWCAYSADPNKNFWMCYGAGFTSGTTDLPLPPVDGQTQKSIPGSTSPFTFTFSDHQFTAPGGTITDPQDITINICWKGVFCCGSSVCSQDGVPPKSTGCTPQTGLGNPTVCSLPPSTPSCDQIRNDEPHQLRPNPGAPCVDKPDPAGRLSCASDFEMHHVIDDPYGWGAFSCPPGDLSGFTDKSNEKPYDVSVDVKESTVIINSQPVKTYACAYQYSRVLQYIEFTPEIDHTLLDLPIAGLASRSCQGQSPGEGCLADKQPAAALLSNYTSWYHQGVTDPAVAGQTFSSQLAEALANYMNFLIDKKASGEIPGNVKLLSPAFNITNAATPPLFADMEAAGANFSGLDGMAGNTYTLVVNNDVKTAYFWYTEFLQSKVKQYHKPMMFTEFGDFRTATQPKGNRPGLIAEMESEFDKTQKDSDINAILYFAAIDSDLSNPAFTFHRLTDGELAQITSPNLAKSGAGSGWPVQGNGAYSDAVKARNLKWSIEIAFKPTDDQAVIGAFNRALDQGLTPVLRICAGPTCDFSDPQVYAQFLKTIADGLNGRTFWAIAGPNEPETEPWVLTNTTPGSTPVQADWLTLLGPIRKLIPKKVLDARKNDVIDRALLPAGNPNKSYNQIAAFVKDGKVMPRSQAIKARDFDQIVRLSDMAGHRDPGPEDQPWRDIWENYMVFTSTSDLPGRVFITVGSQETAEFKQPKLVITDPKYKVAFPHNRELDEASNLLQSIFKPLSLPETTNYKETRINPDYYDTLDLATTYTTVRGKTVTGKASPQPAFDTQACNLIAKTNSGDRLHDERSPSKDNTIKGTLFVTKPVVFSGTLYSANAGTTSLPSRGESVGTIGVYIQTPPAADNVWDRLINGPASVLKAVVPPGLIEGNDIPGQSKGLGYYCGPDCRVNPTSPAAFFPHWGSVLDLFHEKLQLMLNPIQ